MFKVDFTTERKKSFLFKIQSSIAYSLDYPKLMLDKREMQNIHWSTVASNPPKADKRDSKP